MKSFFLAAQAAAAEADEQRRFCSGAVQYRSGLVIDGSLLALTLFSISISRNRSFINLREVPGTVLLPG